MSHKETIINKIIFFPEEEISLDFWSNLGKNRYMKTVPSDHLVNAFRIKLQDHQRTIFIFHLSKTRITAGNPPIL